MGFNGVVEIDKAIEFYLSMQRVFKLNALVPHLHNGTNDTLSLTIGLRSGCNPPTKKHQLKVEISRKLLQGEFL